VAKIDAIVAQMRANPTNVLFSDACKVATFYFGEPRQSGSSHRVWKMPWPGDPRVNLQRGEGGKAKAYQVRQLIKAIDRLEAERDQAR
jgi:hypothetical protein